MVSSKGTGDGEGRVKPQMTQNLFALYTVAVDGQTYGIIGAAFEVHKRLGAGFLEAVYKEALSIELVERGIPFCGEAEVPVLYKRHKLKHLIARISSATIRSSSNSRPSRRWGTLRWLKCLIICGQPDSRKLSYSISARRVWKSGGW
jgi:PD-(D/E)XK nuclease superfamily